MGSGETGAGERAGKARMPQQWRARWTVIILALVCLSGALVFRLGRDQALWWAVGHGRVRTTDLLLTLGASSDAASTSGWTVLHCAAYSGDEPIVEKLLDAGASVDAVDGRSRTPLHMAVRGRHLETARLLLRRGADANMPEYSGWTPLFRAAYDADVAMVTLLLDNGADATYIDEERKEPVLSVVSSYGGGEPAGTVKALLAHGAQLEARDWWQQTPLFSSDPVLVQALLDHGADVEARDLLGQTPLFAAAQGEGPEAVTALLAHGAQVDAQDEEGRTPLVVAVRRREKGKEVAEVLFQTAPGPDLVAGVLFGDEPSVGECLREVPGCVGTEYQGRSALHWAVLAGRTGVVKTLLDAGADVNVRDGFGRTPLHGIAGGGPSAIVELLLAHGADSNARDKDGRTPTDEAAAARNQAVLDLMRQSASDAQPN